MIEHNGWDEEENGHHDKERSIDVRPCACGSVHLTFFGRTTFHLSRNEFMEFSKGVSRVAKGLKQDVRENGMSILQTNGLSH